MHTRGPAPLTMEDCLPNAVGVCTECGDVLGPNVGTFVFFVTCTPCFKKLAEKHGVKVIDMREEKHD